MATLSVRDIKALWGEAAGRCSFRDTEGKACMQRLVEQETATDAHAIVGENAHIEGEKEGAARYRASMTDEERNSYPNLVLMCPKHHTIIDKQQATYTVHRLKAMKAEHERWIRLRVRPEEVVVTPRESYVTETVHASLMEVEQAPTRVFRVTCTERNLDAALAKVGPSQHCVFIVKRGTLYSFRDPRVTESGLGSIVVGRVKTVTSEACLKDEVLERYYVELLNRSAQRSMQDRGLLIDEKHGRAFFSPNADGTPREESYLSLAGRWETRKVAWSPITKATGKPKTYWVHRAVQLRFLRVTGETWVMSIRPDFHLTSDGSTPLPSERIGPIVTRRKAQMWNRQVHQEVRFWLSYLGQQTPRLILQMGGQALVISCNLIRATVAWPGVAGDVQPIKEPDFEEDLFSAADLQEVKESEAHSSEFDKEDE